jgi:hypothetical protein
MKFATLAVVVMASTVASAALAQDGGGHGPPIKAANTFTGSPDAAVMNTSLGSLSKLFQPKLDLVPATK